MLQSMDQSSGLRYLLRRVAAPVESLEMFGFFSCVDIIVQKGAGPPFPNDKNTIDSGSGRHEKLLTQ